MEKLKVKLISYSMLVEKKGNDVKDPDRIVAESGAISHSKEFKDLSSDKVEHLINLLRDLGHESVFEHVSFTFSIEGISRVCSHQLVRHRMASFTQQSQRYVPLDPDFIVPESINNSEFKDDFLRILEESRDLYKKMVQAGIKKEDARFILPQAVETKIIVTMNGRELRHFINLRAGKEAQWEIRAVALEMLKQAHKVSPILFDDLYKKFID
ncbi:MAG: FAD-dependent thymidylate synthase [Thermoplasmata archaeon]|jgi:thymidylate synthase (FAD)|nr:FAD-dependent thymidylate synthase [Thermoplasmata archaeon]MVT13493.1 FAD-dependent thymidylate synthase [Euryarchaeota archaeon]MVT14570.1 FAD-dependent thymidylate synthase [Euryarchaeota archaeon]MVT35390.1 FAD-dependent thymidylate synthase [Euryarchaeota archaeon]